MTKKGWMAAGLTVGLIAGSCVSAFAAEGLKYVQASINDTFKFQVNGEAKALDDEYTVLVYKDRTYLPVRGIGELMGADIDWDDATKTILIDTSNLSGNEDSTSQTPEEEIPTIEYKTLPLSYENVDFKITIRNYVSNQGTEKLSKLYFNLEALGEEDIRINPSNICFYANGLSFEKYSMDVDRTYQDKKLYSEYASEDNDLSGFITLPNEIKSAEKIIIAIPVQKDTSKGQEETIVTFNIDTEAK